MLAAVTAAPSVEVVEVVDDSTLAVVKPESFAVVLPEDGTQVYDPQPEPLNFTKTRSVASEYFTVKDIISGKTVTMTELIDEVGINAARYFFATKSLDTQMNFDITLAKKQSNDNPVYYVEYAHARICSILNNINNNVDIEEYKTIDSEYAYDLLNKVYEFRKVVENAAIRKMPHLITNYVYELATLFHSYYSHEKIISDDIVYTSERINLIKTVKITIKNALNLIGVEALEKM